MMDKNIRLARELLKIARNLAASDAVFGSALGHARRELEEFKKFYKPFFTFEEGEEDGHICWTIRTENNSEEREDKVYFKPEGRRNGGRFVIHDLYDEDGEDTFDSFSEAMDAIIEDFPDFVKSYKNYTGVLNSENAPGGFLDDGESIKVRNANFELRGFNVHGLRGGELVWYDGIWEDGQFGNPGMTGYWYDGTWLDGTWNGKAWLGGYDSDGNYHEKGDSPDKWGK